MTVITVPKDKNKGCVCLVNQSWFGLGSRLYCSNVERRLHVGCQFCTGMFTVNDFGTNYLIQSLPFGGTNSSGFGQFAGIEGLPVLCLERSIVVDWIPGVKTSIPPPLDYPMERERSFGFADSLIQLFYNEQAIGKVRGILGLIKHG